MRLTLTHQPDGVEKPEDGLWAVYDIERNEAHFGRCSTAGPTLVWELHDTAPIAGALLSAEVYLDPTESWLMRCDRIDFPPGAIAYRHTHPGPGIRCQLFGELTVETQGRVSTYGPLGAWFEAGPDTVYAEATDREDSAFARVMLLPRRWEGRRTIRYVDPADQDKPKTQRATIFFDHLIDLRSLK